MITRLLLPVYAGLCLLSALPYLEAKEEGDICTLKGNLAGICRVASECEPVIIKYIKSGRLTSNDVPTCSLGTHEEIVCCPIAECCSDDPRPRQVLTTSSTTTTTTKTTTTTTTTPRIPLESSTRDLTVSQSMLDKESAFFDFQQLLNNGKPSGQSQQPAPSPTKPIPPVITHESMRAQPISNRVANREQPIFQSMGAWGQAPPGIDRQPKIINRPPTRPNRGPPIVAPGPRSMPGRGRLQQQPLDLVQLVNEQLRQQGMNIVSAKEVDTFQQWNEATLRTTTTTRRPPTTTIASELDPWAPFRFRPRPTDDAVTIGPDTTTSTTTTTAATTTSSTTTTRTIQPTPTTRVDVTPDNERPAVRACRNIEARQDVNLLTTHILDGIPVDEGIYPHMAAIAFSTFGTFAYRCGGSLISKRHVLTAAHCVNSQSESPVHVRLGTVNIEQPTNHSQDIPLTNNIIIHPEYVSSSKYNDIALLELAEDAEFSYYIYPACLDTNLVDPPANAQVFVAGWGTMNTITRATSKILLRAPLSIVSGPQCNVSYLEQPNSRRFLPRGITDTLLCAADKRQKADACQGDSGGPLVLERDIVNSKYSIVGIISAGFGCATKTPGLYTRVASYLDFIEGVVWPNNVV